MKYPEILEKSISNDSQLLEPLIKSIKEAIYLIQVLGAQLSSRCLSIDGSSSKCRPILTYTKRHSPDIAPSDCYLFRSMAHGLADQQFRSYDYIEKYLDSWIASEDEHFYRNGI